MLNQIRPALALLVIFTLLLGIAYPLAMTGLGAGLFGQQAQGSPVVRDGVVVGSRLIGQQFTRPEYFWGRPSAAGAGYDGRASAGSNLGPSSQALVDRIAAAAEKYGQPAGEIPADLLLASGSGLDPHISPAAARFQIARVATARGVPQARITELVDAHVEKPSLGFLGEPRVNVLELNLALDEIAGS